MKVTTISANIRFSKDIGYGAWKVIEVGAETTLDAKDTWQAAQHQLYGELSQQLQRLWANGKVAQNDHDGARESPKASEPPSAAEHWCLEHQTSISGTSDKARSGLATKGPMGSGVGRSRLSTWPEVI